MRVAPWVQGVEELGEFERGPHTSSTKEIGDLPMHGKIERSILDGIEVQTVQSTGEVESADKSALVGEQSSVNKVECLRKLFRTMRARLQRKVDVRPTFAMSINLRYLQECVCMPWRPTKHVPKPLRI